MNTNGKEKRKVDNKFKYTMLLVVIMWVCIIGLAGCGGGSSTEQKVTSKPIEKPVTKAVDPYANVFLGAKINDIEYPLEYPTSSDKFIYPYTNNSSKYNVEITLKSGYADDPDIATYDGKLNLNCALTTAKNESDAAIYSSVIGDIKDNADLNSSINIYGGLEDAESMDSYKAYYNVYHPNMVHNYMSALAKTEAAKELYPMLNMYKLMETVNNNSLKIRMTYTVQILELSTTVNISANITFEARYPNSDDIAIIMYLPVFYGDVYYNDQTAEFFSIIRTYKKPRDAFIFNEIQYKDGFDLYHTKVTECK